MTVNPIPGYMINDQDLVDSNNLYYGFTDQDGNWYIMNQTSGGNTIRYARGLVNNASNTYNYSGAWSLHAIAGSLTYDVWKL